MPQILVLIVLAVLASPAFAGPPFSEDVAPIGVQNGTSGHRPGQAGPVPRPNDEEVKKRGRLLVAVTETHYMPPWHAEPGDVAFADARRLRDDEIATLKAWVDAGMPEGDPAAAPTPPEYAEGWLLGEPDLTIRMDEPFQVPADGPDLYEYFVLDIPISEKKYIRALEFLPEARTVVHHILGFLVPGEKIEARKGRGFGALTNDRNRVLTWAIGTNPRILPAEVAVPVEPGTKMVIQTHFHPTGKVEHERSQVGLHFADEPPTREYIEVQIPPAFGEISGVRVPAGSDAYTLRETLTLPVDVRAFSTFAHAHYIGKAFDLTAQLPGGKSLKILDIDNYDFAWQELYNLEEPLFLPAGTKLTSVVRWDNTARNPSNPYDPPRTIHWGPFSEDEMGSIILDVMTVRAEDEPKLLEALEERKDLSAANFLLGETADTFKGRSNPGRYWLERGEKALQRFDKNGDGKLSGDEREEARNFLTEKGFDLGPDRTE